MSTLRLLNLEIALTAYFGNHGDVFQRSHELKEDERTIAGSQEYFFEVFKAKEFNGSGYFSV